MVASLFSHKGHSDFFNTLILNEGQPNGRRDAEFIALTSLTPVSYTRYCLAIP
jgi:hypothetical protein